MWGRWAWAHGVFMALVLFLPGCSIAADLRGVRINPVPDGAAVAFYFSENIDANVIEVSDADGSIRRLYVDLPKDTIVAPDARQITTGVEPVARTRVGQGDDGSVRVVIDVSGGAEYRVERDTAARTMTIIVAAKARTKAAPRAEAPKTPARRTPPGRAANGKPAAEKPIRIVLDPGHGGTDPGAGSDGFALEKDVTLAITTRLATLLRARLDAVVVLTRTEDATLALSERTARANTEGADLFISVHGNSSPSGDLHGVETYYLNNTDDRGSMRLAAMENGLDLLHPADGKQTDLRFILSDMIQVGKMDQSIQLARAIQRGLVRGLRAEYPDVRDLGVKKGPFYVLVGAYMPCVLVEVAFLNHPVEGRRLATSEYQELIAQGLYNAIAQYLGPRNRRRTL